MAQSYSGACEGLWSAEEGDRTYTFWTGNNNCFLHKGQIQNRCIEEDAVFPSGGFWARIELLHLLGQQFLMHPTD